MAATGHLWEKARNALKYPVMHGIAPAAKSYLAPNISGTKVEKSHSNINPHNVPMRQELFMPIL